MTSKTKIIRISLSAITAALLIMQMSSIGISSNFANASAGQSEITVTQQTENIPPKLPETNLTQAQKDNLIDIAMNAPKLKSLANSGWKFITFEYYGVTEPVPEWTSVKVQFKLPKEIKTRLNCDKIGGYVEIDLKTNEIIDSYVPDETVDCNGSITFGRPSDSHDKTGIPEFVPRADAITSTNGLLGSLQNDVVSAAKYGGWATLSTPNIDDTDIYTATHMDKFVGFLYNQDFGTLKYLQTGWLVTAVNGCAGCNISAGNKYLVYVDESTWGDLEAHKITASNGIAYVEGNSDLAQILCNGGSNYRIQATSNGKSFQIDSQVPCGTATTNNAFDNSVFFENKNTLASSSWSGDITSSVTASGAKEYDTTTHFQNWSASDKKYQTCGANAQIGTTTAITGSLAAGGTATWATLSATPDC